MGSFLASIHSKVKASAAAGLILTLVATGLDALGYHPDPRIAAAVTTVGGLAAGYLKRGPTTLADAGLSVSPSGPLTFTSHFPVTVVNGVGVAATPTVTIIAPAGPPLPV